MAFTLPELPYATNALEPYLSAETFEYHYGKHHKAYVDTLNQLVAGTEDENASLEDIILKAEGKLFNQAAQVWNHTLYWNSMAPGGGGAPSGAAGDAIDEHFGGYDKFREEFKAAAVGQFGSGWAWLTHDDGKLADLGDRQRRPADQARVQRRADVRRVGARLLHRLSQRPAQLRRRLPRQPHQLEAARAGAVAPCVRLRPSDVEARERCGDPLRGRGAGHHAQLGEAHPRQRLDQPPAGVDLEPAVRQLGGASAWRGGCCAGPRRRSRRRATADCRRCCRRAGDRSGARSRSPPPSRRGRR